jgi:peroxiredoxin
LQPWLKQHSSLIGVAVIIGLIYGIWPYLQKQSYQAPAPDFSTQTLKGQTVHLQDYSGKPMVLHFWATWCQVCQYEMPEINQLAQTYPTLNIAADSGNDEEVIEFAQKHQMDLNLVVNDRSQTLKQQFQVMAYPTTFVIDSNGIIIHKKVGKTTAKQLIPFLESNLEHK